MKLDKGFVTFQNGTSAQITSSQLDSIRTTIPSPAVVDLGVVNTVTCWPDYVLFRTIQCLDNIVKYNGYLL